MSGIHLPTVTTGRSAGWIINQASEKANIPQTSQGSSPDACISRRQLCKSFDTGKLNTSIACTKKRKSKCLVSDENGQLLRLTDTNNKVMVYLQQSRQPVTGRGDIRVED